MSPPLKHILQLLEISLNSNAETFRPPEVVNLESSQGSRLPTYAGGPFR